MICAYCGEENCYCPQKLMETIFSNLVGNKLLSVKVSYKEIEGTKKWAAYQKWVDEDGKKYYTVTNLPLKFISKEEFLSVKKVKINKIPVEEKLERSLRSLNEYSEDVEEEDGTRGDCLPRTDGMSDKKFKKKLDKELDEYAVKRDLIRVYVD